MGVTGNSSYNAEAWALVPSFVSTSLVTSGPQFPPLQNEGVGPEGS